MIKMATSFNCSCKMSLNPPPIACSVPPPKATKNPWSGQSSRCFSYVAVASFVISSSLVVFLSIEEGYEYFNEKNQQPVLQVVEKQGGKAMRWRERSCPQWRTNALENIVPENLPRPSDTRRRSNSMTVDHWTIPPADHVINRACFSL